MKLKPLQRFQLAICLFICLFSSLLFIISCCINYRHELAKEHVRFRQEMPTMDSWINSPFGILKSYLFNVTNSEEFYHGYDTKLKLQQIGPIVYKIVGYNDILERTENNVTYRKHRYRHVEFVPEESVSPDILNKTIILPNSILLGTAAKLSHDAPLAALGFDAITLGDDVFVQGSVYYFLWEFTQPGLEMMAKLMPLTSNCGLLHNALKEKDEVYTVNIGPKSGIENFFRIKTLNDQLTIKEQRQRLNGPDGENCPAYVKGALDNSLFPPFIQKDTPLTILAIESCRTLPLIYQEEQVYQGISIYRYTLIKPYEEQPKCLQRTYSVKLPRGMFDASKCVINDAPASFCQPHFYGTDYNWSNHFEGLTPNKQDHEAFVLLEPVTGIPINEKYRFQSNIPVPNLTQFSNRLRKFSNMIIPTFWYEFEMGELPELVTRLMWVNVNIVPHLQWSVLTISFLLALWSGLKVLRLYYGNITYRQLYHRICCNQAGGRTNVLLATTFPQSALTQCQTDVNVK